MKNRVALLVTALCTTAFGPTARGDTTIAVEQQVLKAADPQPSDHFGIAVAISGDTAVVGAEYDESAQGPHTSGVAYVFERSGTSWGTASELPWPNPTTGAEIGFAVAIDLDTIVVGAPGSGRAAVFVRQGASWIFQDEFAAPAGTEGFGSDVAVSGDTIVVGAPYDDVLASNAGRSFVYTRSGSSWSLDAELHAPDPLPNDGFGGAVAIHGGFLAVGARGHGHGGVTGSGSAYVFARVAGVWTLMQELLAADPDLNDAFGSDVAIHLSTILVGAVSGDSPMLDDSGCAYVFDRVGTTWEQREKLFPTDAGVQFGASLSIAGNLAIVGAPNGGDASGAAFAFRRENGIWSGGHEFFGSTTTAYDGFGSSVSVSGVTALVGGPRDDHQYQTDDRGTGYAFVLTQPGSVGTAFCFGDSCPCANPDGGAGCANSSGHGATLVAEGTTSVAVDALCFIAENLLPAQPALLFVGTESLGGGTGLPFGDGLQCAGGTVVRLGVTVPDAAGRASWSSGFVDAGGWSAGDVRRFQVWYRDPQGSPCGSLFNLTNGVEITFSP